MTRSSPLKGLEHGHRTPSVQGLKTLAEFQSRQGSLLHDHPMLPPPHCLLWAPLLWTLLSSWSPLHPQPPGSPPPRPGHSLWKEETGPWSNLLCTGHSQRRSMVKASSDTSSCSSGHCILGCVALGGWLNPLSLVITALIASGCSAAENLGLAFDSFIHKYLLSTSLGCGQCRKLGWQRWVKFPPLWHFHVCEGTDGSMDVQCGLISRNEHLFIHDALVYLSIYVCN